MSTVALATDVGMGIVTNRMKGAGTEPNFIGWGTGATAPVAGNTVLQTAAAEARATGVSTRVLTNVANDTYQVVGSITCAGSAKAITEIGLFDAATAGNLFARATFLPINLSVGDSTQFTVLTVFDQGV